MASDKKQKQPAVTDPLEAAKIATKPPPPAPAPPPPEPELHLPVEGAVEPPPAAKPRAYRVATTTSVSLGGQIVRLVQGDVVSESEYGPRGVAQILAANVALVEI